MATKLKYYPKKKIYSNSNGSCTYDPETGNGYSFKWWRVSAIIDGLPFFNDYSYSATTSGHQSRIYALFSDNYSRTDIIRVKCRDGLKDIIQIESALIAERDELSLAMDKGRNGSRAQERRNERYIEVCDALGKIMQLYERNQSHANQ